MRGRGRGRAGCPAASARTAHDACADGPRFQPTLGRPGCPLSAFQVRRDLSAALVVCVCLACCRRIARATGATVVGQLADMEGNESFDASLLGSAEEVYEQRVADDAMLVRAL